MASVQRTFTWDDVDEPAGGDLVDAFEWFNQALVRAVEASQPALVEYDCSIFTEMSIVHRVDDVRQSIARLGEQPRSIVAGFHPENSAAHNVQAADVSVRSTGEGKISILLSVRGVDVDETHGFFHMVKNQLDVAVRAVPAKSDAVSSNLISPEHTTGQPFVVSPTAGPTPNVDVGRTSWWQYVSKHPLYSAIIAAFVVALVIWLIGQLR